MIKNSDVIGLGIQSQTFVNVCPVPELDSHICSLKIFTSVIYPVKQVLWLRVSISDWMNDTILLW